MRGIGRFSILVCVLGTLGACSGSDGVDTVLLSPV